jgi:hypothetical protein
MYQDSYFVYAVGETEVGIYLWGALGSNCSLQLFEKDLPIRLVVTHD